MKKIIVCLLCLVLCLTCLAGCKKENRVPITEKQFLTILEQNNFEVEKSYVDDMPFKATIVAAYDAYDDSGIYDDDELALGMIFFSDENGAKAAFDYMTNMLKSRASMSGEQLVTDSKNSGNFNYFSATANGYTMVVTRIANTLYASQYTTSTATEAIRIAGLLGYAK